jgi:competence protein ComEC
MKNIILNNRVECFFIANIICAVFFKNLFFLHLFLSILIIVLYIREKFKYPFIILIVLLKLFLLNSFVIIDVDSAHKDGIQYSTSIGKTTLKDYYSPGSVIFKWHLHDSKDSLRNYRLPIVSSILEFRKNFAESLYLNSNGILKLTQALVLGDRSYIPIEINDKFIITGLIHLLAISGLHVAIITTLFFFLLFFIPKKLKYLIVSFILLLYIPLAAFNVPVIRACLCAIIIMVLFFFDVKVDYRKFLLSLASLFIIINPAIITDLSFIMSFLAVGGIVYLGFNSKNRVLNAIYIGLAAQTAVMPLTLYTFGMTNISSLFSTLIILPFIGMNIFVGLLSIINPEIFVPMLIYIEKTVIYIVNKLYICTYITFFLYKISISVFLLMLLIMFIVFYVPKHRWLIFSVYIFLFIPVKNEYGYYVYTDYRNLSILLVQDHYRELYFKGEYYFYKYKLLPQLAKMKIKTFDSGIISIKRVSNQYISVNGSNSLNTICTNKGENDCSAFYENNYLYLQSGKTKNSFKIYQDKLNFITYN